MKLCAVRLRASKLLHSADDTPKPHPIPSLFLQKRKMKSCLRSILKHFSLDVMQAYCLVKRFVMVYYLSLVWTKCLSTTENSFCFCFLSKTFAKIKHVYNTITNILFVLVRYKSSFNIFLSLFHSLFFP